MTNGDVRGKGNIRGGSTKKAQSELEYLLTYGWAILIVAIILSVIYLFVFSPSAITPSTCTFSAGAYCQDFTLASNSVQSNVEMLLTNMQPYPVADPKISINYSNVPLTSGSCVPTLVAAGGAIICNVTLSQEVLAVGTLASGGLMFSAIPCQSGDLDECAGTQNQTYIGKFSTHVASLPSSAISISVSLSANTASVQADGSKDRLTATIELMGTPISGATVIFAESSPQFATIAPLITTSDSNGNATSFISSLQPGTASVTASFANVISAPITITFLALSTVTSSTSTTTSTTSTSTSTTTVLSTGCEATLSPSPYGCDGFPSPLNGYNVTYCWDCSLVNGQCQNSFDSNYGVCPAGETFSGDPTTYLPPDQISGQLNSYCDSGNTCSLAACDVGLACGGSPAASLDSNCNIAMYGYLSGTTVYTCTSSTSTSSTSTTSTTSTIFTSYQWFDATGSGGSSLSDAVPTTLLVRSGAACGPRTYSSTLADLPLSVVLSSTSDYPIINYSYHTDLPKTTGGGYRYSFAIGCSGATFYSVPPDTSSCAGGTDGSATIVSAPQQSGWIVLNSQTGDTCTLIGIYTSSTTSSTTTILDCSNTPCPPGQYCCSDINIGKSYCVSDSTACPVSGTH